MSLAYHLFGKQQAVTTLRVGTVDLSSLRQSKIRFPTKQKQVYNSDSLHTHPFKGEREETPPKRGQEKMLTQSCAEAQRRWC